jgi:hypothetical protein
MPPEAPRPSRKRRVRAVAWILLATAAVFFAHSPSGASRPNEENASPPHRIAIRTVAGAGELYDRVTRQRFVPRGANYHRFEVAAGGVEDRTFASWSRRQVVADLNEMRSLGYNSVRIALDICQSRCIGSPSGGLRAGYLDRVAEFLRLAKARNLRLLLHSNDLPKQGGYGPQVEATCCSAFDGYINAQHLSPTGYRVYREYWTTVIRGLVARRAPLDTILAYSIRNEMFFVSDKAPLSLGTGSVRTANGRTYRLPSERDRMIHDGTVFWLNGIRAAIRKLDPTALVGVGAFAPNGPNQWRPADDPRAVFMEPIFASAVDFVDVHPYPGYATFDRLAANFLLDRVGQRKPVLMAEFGGFRFAFANPARAASAVMDWQVASCAFGVDGWMHWHWRGQNDPEMWTGTDGAGVLNTVLAPRQRPDPCVRKTFPGIETNLALGRPVTASAQAGSPASNAVDGSAGTAWVSGGDAPQWIEVDLGAPVRVVEVRLRVAQTPAGHTAHRVLVLTPAGWSTLASLGGTTEDDQVLSIKPATPIDAVRAVRVETSQSPSWVAWKEIEVLG